jgi:hypothetical protein
MATLIKFEVPITVYLICALHAKIHPNAIAETVNIPFEKVGETGTLKSVVHHKAGP